MMRKLWLTIAALFSRLGVSVSLAPSVDELSEVIALYKPISIVKIPMIRIGSDHDGGYLVPDCLSDISECFSPGVDVVSDFEIGLESHGIGSHLVDYSVSGPPASFEPLSFTKKYIGVVTEGRYVSLCDWVRSVETDCDRNALLQMDIEGSEYSALLAAPESLMDKFKVVVLELHGLRDLSNRRFFNIFTDFSKKLLSTHTVVHLHPNNFMRKIKIRGFSIHPTIEVTLVRKDFLSDKDFTYTKNFPHRLDSPCVGSRAEVCLDKSWYL